MSRVRKIKSFENFSGELQKSGPELVVVQADVRPVRGLFKSTLSGAVGRLGEYDHGLVYTVRTVKNERLYRERLFTAFQSQYGVADSEKRNERVMSILLAGGIRAGQLGLMLSDVEVYLGGPDLKPMPEEKLEELHQQAQELGVSPPEFAV